MGMTKKKIKLEDRRYLIYYSFDTKAASGKTAKAYETTPRKTAKPGGVR